MPGAEVESCAPPRGGLNQFQRALWFITERGPPVMPLYQREIRIREIRGRPHTKSKA